MENMGDKQDVVWVMDWLSGGWLTAFILAIFSVSVDGCQQAPNGDVFSKSLSAFGCQGAAPLGVEFDDTPIVSEPGIPVTVFAVTSGGTTPFEFDWEWSAEEGWGYGYTQLPTFTFTPPVEEIDVTYVVVVGVTDAKGQFATAEKEVTVKGAGTEPDNPDPENHAPTANPQSLSTPFETAKSVVLTGTDPDGDTLVITIDSPPSHGTLDGMGSNVVYTPNAEFSGLDNFTFRVSDGTVSDTAVVSITVGEPDNPPQGSAKVFITAFPTAGGSPGDTTLNANVYDLPPGVRIDETKVCRWDKEGDGTFETPDSSSLNTHYVSGTTVTPQVEVPLTDGTKVISPAGYEYVVQ